MIEEGTFVLIDGEDRLYLEIVEEAAEILKRRSIQGSKLKAVIKLDEDTYRVVYEFETSN